jgi:hypothetical protein
MPNTCSDGGFDCIQMSVAKSNVWKFAMPDEKKEWLNDAIKVEQDVILQNNFMPPTLSLNAINEEVAHDVSPGITRRS